MKYTFEQCVDNLNGMVEGLGDRFRDNRKRKTNNPRSMMGWISSGFLWDKSPEGLVFWGELYDLFKEAQL